ncbi:MAG: hypothetical protein ABGY41_20995 [Candidatus Poribacteria bacterium]
MAWVVAIAFVCSAASAASVYEWEAIEGPYGNWISDLRSDAHGTLYARAGRYGYGTSYSSSDEGRSWNEGNPPERLLYQHDTQGAWYRLLEDGIDLRGYILRSRDQGATWQLLNTVYGRHFFGRLYVEGDDLYVNTEAGLLHSPDRGETWPTAILPAPDRFTSVVDALLVEGTTLTVLHRGGVRRSENRGQTWFALTADVFHGSGELVRFRGDLYATGWTDAGPSLFRSTDDGRTWTVAMDSLTGSSVVAIEPTPHGLYASTLDAGVLRTVDGLTWEPRNVGIPAPAARIDASDGILYTASAHSEDDGRTWVDIPRQYPTAGLADAGAEEWGVGRYRYRHAWRDSHVWSSDDAGATWRPTYEVPTKYLGNIIDLAVDGSRHVLLTQDGALLSLDGGATLQLAGAGIPVLDTITSLEWVGGRRPPCRDARWRHHAVAG